jgi:hypothetical protein
MMKTISEAT